MDGPRRLGQLASSSPPRGAARIDRRSSTGALEPARPGPSPAPRSFLRGPAAGPGEALLGRRGTFLNAVASGVLSTPPPAMFCLELVRFLSVSIKAREGGRDAS